LVVASFIINLNDATFLKINMKIKIYILSLLFLSSCATYKTQYGKNHLDWKNKVKQKEKPIYSIYLIGDAGKLNDNGVNNVINAVGLKLKNEPKNSALIYLGDNVYPNGFPKKHTKNRQEAENILDAQINIVKETDTDIYVKVQAGENWHEFVLWCIKNGFGSRLSKNV